MLKVILRHFTLLNISNANGFREANELVKMFDRKRIEAMRIHADLLKFCDAP